jgi:hypothetical protein
MGGSVGGFSESGTSDYERGTSTDRHRMASDAGSPDMSSVSAMPAGTWNPYDTTGRVVIPDELARTHSGVTETEFLTSLSIELSGHLAKADAQGAVMPAEQIYRLLVDARTIILGPSQMWNPIDPWLQQRLVLDETASPGDYIERILALVDAGGVALVGQAAEQVKAMAPEEARLRHTGEEDNEITVDDFRFVPEIAAANAAGMPPAPPSSLTPTSDDGRLLHLIIQVHYVLTHPANTIMIENRVIWPGGMSTIQHLGGLGGLGAAGRELALIRLALMTKRGLTKLPDILDVTFGEVYEIKPRNGIRKGVIQLHKYLTRLADVGLNRYRPGTSWRASPIYPVPPRGWAFIWQAPGIIAYDLAKPPPAPPGGWEFGFAKWVTVAGLAVAVVVTVATPAVGDEAAVAIALLRAFRA